MDPAAVNQVPPDKSNGKTQLDYEIESFQKYLDLPWDNLENFTKTVKAYEAKFENDLEEYLKAQSKNRNDEGGKLAVTEFYLPNVFHVFNHPITEPPSILQNRLKLWKLKAPAIELLNQKNWDDLKDNDNQPLDITTIKSFLEELTIRIFNLNFVLSNLVLNKDTEIITLKDKYIKLLPDLDTMEFHSVNEDNAEFLHWRFQLYFTFLEPRVVFSTSAPTAAFTELNDYLQVKDLNAMTSYLDHIPNYKKQKVETPTKEKSIRNHLYLTLKPFLQNAFHNESFPKSTITPGLAFFVDNYSTVDTIIAKNFEKSPENNNVLESFDQPIYGWPGLTIELRGRAVVDKELDELSHKICLIEVWNQGDFYTLAKEYFEKKKFYTSTSSETGSTSNKTIVDNGQLQKDVIGESDVSSSGVPRFLLQTIAYCKMNGTPLCILTNGYDFIILSVNKFYDKIQNIDSIDPKEVNIFSDWNVTIFEGDNMKVSLFTAICSIIMDECNKFISNRVVSNAQLINYNITNGSSHYKKVLDKIRYLMSRKTFTKLMLKKPFKMDVSKLDFTWKDDNDLKENCFKYRTLYAVVENAVSKIVDSLDWKDIKSKNRSTQESNITDWSILDSSTFKVLNFLQNEIWCTNIGATTMTCSNEKESKLVLKLYDVNRMPHSNELFVEFKDGKQEVANFQTILKMSFEFFFKEIHAYQRLGTRECLPTILDYGFLYIPDLKPDTLAKDAILYENYFIKTGRELKTEAPFLSMEFVEMISIDEMTKIDFDQLKSQASHDLSLIHKAGVAVGDICPRNIIIKKTGSGDYKVVFIDFGHSIITVERGKRNKLVSQLEKSDITMLVDSLDYYSEMASDRIEVIKRDKRKAREHSEDTNAMNT